jgi:glycerol-3-phosphate cytidylyltransferase
MKMKTIITFGTYDLFHIGHLKLLKRAKAYGERLVVGISSDDLNYSKKSKLPVFNQKERIEIVSSLSIVDEVFLEESLEKKGDYIRIYGADTLIMGDDWLGRFDEYRDLCDVIYLPRTPMISTTSIIEVIKSND